MSHGMSPRTQKIASGIAAVATTVLLMSTLVGAFDAQLLQIDGAAPESRSDVTAEARRDDRTGDKA
jgi:hypothetical protein